MVRRRVFGLSLLLLGVIVFFMGSVTSITGFSISEHTMQVGKLIFQIIGSSLIVLGALIFISEGRAYAERESKLREVLGSAWERVSDKDRLIYNKSLRRHLTKEGRRVGERQANNTVNEPEIIRTKYFDKAIKGHEAEIEKAIEKLRSGRGKKEKLAHRDSFSLRTTKGGRIIYDQGEKGKIVLRDYTSDHHYNTK
ncbi:hypothetical protein CMI41_03310 [Candidatus Pacearchaeota archaeon]|nr:hypothetical protein [Candidatus Pacearchaeota archaeon]|tara:strand:- start:435 stop:1022 length:588 start_codon:yes stop_codon:yes gene_type:complete